MAGANIYKWLGNHTDVNITVTGYADVQQDRTAKYDVTVTITGISKVSGKENIKILSSEHSR